MAHPVYLPILCAIQMKSEVTASRSPKAVRADVAESSDISASSDDIRQSRDVQEMTSVSSRDADAGVNGNE